MKHGAAPEGASEDAPGATRTAPSALSPVANALLDAVVALGSDLHVDRVLDRIVESACQLADAQYGALAVVGPDDRIDAFVTHGIDDRTRERIGALPRGRGLLGELIREPVPLRLERLQDHPSSAGFPAGHPPMRSFLGVPVRVRGTIFGNLYLTEKAGGLPFTARDEELVVGLAASAGFVIENARAYAVSERQRRWLEAASRIAESVLPETPTAEALHEIAGNARTMTGAPAVAIVLAAEAGESTLLVADGPEAAAIEGLVDERSGAVSQALGGAERHLRLSEDRTVLLLPLPARLARATVLAVLLDGGSPGLPPDLELIRSFADQVALTLDRAQGVRDRASMAVISDRERIARDLHDSVIQRLFAAGLLVQSAMSSPTGAGIDPREVLARVGDDLDQTIADIRTTIFELQSTGSASLRSQVLALAREYASVLGFTVSVRSHGAVDTIAGGRLTDEVMAVLREALTNVARHANAASAWLELLAGPESLTVVAGDDGGGLPNERSEGGLANMRVRAERMGGTCEVASPAAGGTVVRWSVPL